MVTRNEAFLRHAQYYLALVEQANARLRRGNQVKWVTSLEDAHPHTRKILTWCCTCVVGWEVGARLAISLLEFWRIQGYLSEGREWLRRVIERQITPLEVGQRILIARAHLASGELAREQDDYEAAEHHFRYSLEDFEKLSNAGGIADALNGWGRLCIATHHHEAARDFLERGIALYRHHHHRQGLAEATNNMGLLYFARNDYPVAHSRFEESYHLRLKLKDRLGEAGSLNNLGMVAQQQGDYAKAHHYYESALQINTTLGNRIWQANNLHNLGMIALCTGDLAQARGFHERSLEIRRFLGSQSAIAYSLCEIGEIMYKLNDFDAAAVHYEESIAIYHCIGDRWGSATVHYDLGEMARARGRLQEARSHYLSILEAYRNTQSPHIRGIAWVLESLGYLELDDDNAVLAARLLGMASSLMKAANCVFTTLECKQHEDYIRRLGQQLGEDTLSLYWSEGENVSIEHILEFGLTALVHDEPITAVFDRLDTEVSPG